MTQFQSFPSVSIAVTGAISQYPDFASFPVTAADGAMAVALDTGTLYIYLTSDSSWHPVGGTNTYDGPKDLSSTYNSATMVNGDANLIGDTTIDGNLVVTGNFTNSGGYALTVNGSLVVQGTINFTPPQDTVQSDFNVYGDCYLMQGGQFKIATSSTVTLNIRGSFFLNGTLDCSGLSGAPNRGADVSVSGPLISRDGATLNSKGGGTSSGPAGTGGEVNLFGGVCKASTHVTLTGGASGDDQGGNGGSLWVDGAITSLIFISRGGNSGAGFDGGAGGQLHTPPGDFTYTTTGGTGDSPGASGAVTIRNDSTAHLLAGAASSYNLGATDSTNPASQDYRYKKAFIKDALVVGSFDGNPPYGLNNSAVVGLVAAGNLANTSALIGSNNTFFNATAMGFIAFNKDGGASNAPGFFNTNVALDLDVVFGIGHQGAPLDELIRFTEDGDIFAAGALGVGNSAAATVPGTVTKKIEVFDAAGVSLGFLAVYDAIV